MTGPIKCKNIRFYSPLAHSARLGPARLGSARLVPAPSSSLGSAPFGSARPGPARLGSAWLGLALPVHKVGVLRRRNSTLAKKVSFRVDETTSPPSHRHTRFQPQEKKAAFRVDETLLYFVFGFLIVSDRLGSAGLGWARLRVCLPKWVFCVDETAICQTK